MIALSSIIVNETNPRSVKDADYNRLKRSLQKDPEILTVRPLVLHSKNNYKLLAGEQRYNALLDLGYKEVPVNWISFADELNDEQKRRFVLLDNDHAGIWDLPKLTEHWNADELNNWEIFIPSFNENIEMPELLSTIPVIEEKRKTPSATDNDYSVFECVMLHENKVQLLEVLNKIKTDNGFEKIEESIMHLIKSFK